MPARLLLTTTVVQLRLLTMASAGQTQKDNVDRALRALRAISEGATGARLSAFFHQEVIQEELPNRMSPRGATRDLRALLAGAERGQQVMCSQRWTVLSTMAEGDQVALELDWRGVLAAPLGDLPAGH